MTRLQTELDRLYLVPPAHAGENPAARLFDAQGRVRALVLEVVQPTGWDALARAWQGAQAELELPAPAIAVSGTDGLQLWFSLAVPVAPARAHAFLEALRARYLADVAPARVRLQPDPAHPGRHAALVPAPQPATDNWSAWLAPDLAALFSQTPWLDVEPGDEGQSALLRALRPTSAAAFDAALERLALDALPARAAGPAAATPATPAVGPGATDEPRLFLLRVMNDEGVALALRIEAAKALLGHAAEPPPGA